MKKQIENQVYRVLKEAEAMYGIEIKPLTINFKGRGRAAGQARSRMVAGKWHYSLTFNLDSAGLDMNEMLNDTVPHEVAHLVCFIDPGRGRNHDAGWARVCRELGGSGNRTHNQDLLKDKYRKQYLYRTDSGQERIVKSAAKHRNIQRGARYTVRATGESYGRSNFVRVISAAEHKRTHEASVMAARQGPSSTSVEKPARKRMATTGTPSKLDQCRQLYSGFYSRQENIDTFVKSAGCTPAGAATYYAKIKKEKS